MTASRNPYIYLKCGFCRAYMQTPKPLKLTKEQNVSRISKRTRYELRGVCAVCGRPKRTSLNAAELRMLLLKALDAPAGKTF